MAERNYVISISNNNSKGAAGACYFTPPLIAKTVDLCFRVKFRPRHRQDILAIALHTRLDFCG